jgi:hypothetical protein
MPGVTLRAFHFLSSTHPPIMQRQKLFERLGQLLDQQGYRAQKGQILDASIIPVPKQRNHKDENVNLLHKNGQLDMEPFFTVPEERCIRHPNF